jgi:hypothetical protein
MESAVIVLLRLLIIHFVVSALFYGKLFGGIKKKKALASMWTYISAALYAALIYSVNASWRDVLIIPFFFTAWILSLLVCAGIRRAALRLLVFQVILLSFLLSFWVYFYDFNGRITISTFAALLSSRRILLIVAGLVLLIWPTGHIVGHMTAPFRRQLADEELKTGLERAGMWIGCIERTIIYIFVLSNFLTAIAFLVTAKSIFRFGEISKSGNRKEAEYILVGTLLSYAIAMVFGFSIKHLLH